MLPIIWGLIDSQFGNARLREENQIYVKLGIESITFYNEENISNPIRPLCVENLRLLYCH